MLLGLLAAAAGGLVAGSLVEFVVGRLAAGGSPAAPPPHCPRCEHRLGAGDLIPVVSWLRLHGRCRHCRAPIARRHLVVEALTGLLFAGVVLQHQGDGAAIVLGLALGAFLAMAALTDLEHGRLPDLLLAAAAATAVALGLLVDSGGQVERLLSAVAAAAFILLVVLAWPGSAGIDGVKLAAVLGLFLGRDVAVAVLIAVVLSIAVAIASATADKRAGAPAAAPKRRRGASGAGRGMRERLLAGAAGAAVLGQPLVEAYLDAF